LKLNRAPFSGRVFARAEVGILASEVALRGVSRTAEQASEMIERGYRALVLGFNWSLLQYWIAASLGSYDGSPLP
jgi:4-hydroxy-2-oxoheptanedioate aldolase